MSLNSSVELNGYFYDHYFELFIGLVYPSHIFLFPKLCLIILFETYFFVSLFFLSLCNFVYTFCRLAISPSLKRVFLSFFLFFFFFFYKRYTTGPSSSVFPVSRASCSRNVPWWAVRTLLLSLDNDNYRFASVQAWPLTQLAVKPSCNCSGSLMCWVISWGRSYFSGILVTALAAYR